jgi:predicted O-methyltransferase YrrM
VALAACFSAAVHPHPLGWHGHHARDNITKVAEPVDIVFIDADAAGYVDFLRKILPKVRWVHGCCSAESKQQRRAQNQEVRALIRALRQAASLLRPESEFPG